MSTFKHAAKNSYEKLSIFCHTVESAKYTKQLIAKSAEPIPELSASERKEILSYWKQYGIQLKNTEFHRFMYEKSGIRDPRFTPPWVADYIVYPYLNDLRLVNAWDDKAYLDLRLPDFPTPQQIVVNIGGYFHDGTLNRLSREEAVRLIRQYDRVLVKPTIDSGESKGIRFYEAPFDCDQIFSHFRKNYSVQKIVRQSKTLSLLNESSLNCIRVITLQWDGKVDVLSSFVRIGGSGQVTDISSNQFGCAPVRFDGQVGPVGMSPTYSPIRVSQTGTPLCEITVPHFPDVLEMVKRAHLQYPHFGIIGWDIGIDENDQPVIIESNVRCPGPYNPQVFFGPLLGEYTDTILKAIKQSKSKDA